MITKPKALQPGDTVGVVSPSWFGGPAFVRRARRGTAQLERLGFRVRIGRHAFENDGWVSASAERRADDIHSMFRDPEIKAILATIGGDHSCHLLPHLDWDVIRANPKIFMGFSDITVLNNAIHRETGLVTFNGPGLMTDWAEFPEMPEYARQSAVTALTSTRPIGTLSPAPSWTEEFLDWGSGADEARPRIQQPSSGWIWIRGGASEGRVVGGCLESLQHLRGTRWWPDFAGATLFIETSEVRPTPETIDGILMDYENMGVFQQITGMLIARPYGYSNEDRYRLHDIVRRRTEKFSFPVLADIDAGHTSPIMTLPIGCRVRLDSASVGFEIVDSAVTQ